MGWIPAGIGCSGDSAGIGRRREEKAGEEDLAGGLFFGGKRVLRARRSFFVCRQSRNSSEFSF